MKLKFKKGPPFGLFLLCIFYLINAFLFIITTLVFFGYLDILILGEIAQGISVLSIRFLLIILPFGLAFGLYFIRKEAWILAIGYHLFFIINGTLTIFRLCEQHPKLKPILEIALKPEYKIERVLDLLTTPVHIYIVHIMSIIVSMFIIIYLLTKKNLFKI